MRMRRSGVKALWRSGFTERLVSRSPDRLIDRSPIGAIVFLAACASVGAPPGGPIDTDPPVVISASIDTNATGVTAGKLELRFNEIVSERPAVSGGGTGPVTLDMIVLVSPRTGTPKVEWHRDAITIEPRGGFRPNTTYRITLLPGLSDIRGNVSDSVRSFVFSTGPKILPYAILGRVFDWQSGLTAPGAIVEAVLNAGRPDSSIYIAIADTIGQFDLGPLDAGKYLVRGFIDADRNRDRGVLEKWDTLSVTVTDHRPSVELLAAQRDTAPVGIERAEALDSVWVRVRLDKPYEPRQQLQPTQVVLQRSDSSDIPVVSVMTEEQAAFLRGRDTTARPATPPPATAPGERTAVRPPPARPSAPVLSSTIMLRVSPTTPLRAGQRYTLTVRAIRNLVGRAGTSTGVFDGPAVPPKPPA